jgi:hypothetical protein
VSHGVDVESGYGGTRPAPHIESGIVCGDDPRVGHQFWFHPEVSKAVSTNGASFAVVSTASLELPNALQQLHAINVVAPEAVGDAHAIVVRPDRYVAGVANDSVELRKIAETIATRSR